MAADIKVLMTVLNTKYGQSNVELSGKKITIRFSEAGRPAREAEIKSLKKLIKSKPAPTLVAKSGSVSSLKVLPYTINIKPPKAAAKKKGRVNFGVLPELKKKDPSYVLVPPDDVNEIYLMDDFHQDFVKLYNEHGPLTIVLGRFTFKNIVGMNANPGTPKSDISLVATDPKGKLKNVAFISYKKAGGAGAFQQYGGLSKKAGDIIFEDKLVQKWRDDIVSLNKSGFTNSGTNGLKKDVYRPVPRTAGGKKLMNLITYGPDYGRSFGEENCHVIAQGNISFRKMQTAGKYRLEFSDEVINNGDAPTSDGEYRHVFGARNGSGRNVEATDGTKATGIRIGVFPRVYRRSWMRDLAVADGGQKY